LRAQQIKHKFGPGSVALLAACGVGKLSSDNKELQLLDQLNLLGLDAAILSPFDVRPVIGARLALHFAAQEEKARTEHKTVSLLELFRLARAKVEQDPSTKAHADELNEFLLVGNSQIKLCPAAPPS
jgi:hypothetical protein